MPVAIQREIIFVFQLAMRVVIDRCDNGRIGAGRGAVWRRCKSLRMRFQPVG